MVAEQIIKLYREGGVSRVVEGVVDFGRYQAKNHCSGPLGKLVTWRGDEVLYHGVKLDLASPIIEDSLKARFPLDLYERAEMDLIESHLPRDIPVVELGGGIGFISCFTDEVLSDVKHIVLEANPNLIDVIQRNKALNDAQFDVRHAAYHSTDESIEFYMHKKFVGGSIQRSTTDSVDVTGNSLKSLVSTLNANEIALIVDIEGGEFDLIENELDVLESVCSNLFIEFHDFTEADIATYKQRLADSGFSLKEQQGDVCFYKRDS